MELVKDLQEQVAGYYDSVVALLPKLFIGTILSIVLYYILKKIKNRLIKFLSSKADDRLMVDFVNNIFNVFIFILSLLLFLYVIGQFGIAGSILGAATVSSFVIGFAFKDIAENFLAGVIMAFNRPFRIGDTVMTGSVEGNVVAMSLRDTQLKTFEGKDVFVPNGQIIKNPLYNYTIDGFLRGSFTIGVDYDSDIERVRALILNEVNSIEGILKEGRQARTHVKNLNTSTVDIEVHYWIDTFDKKHSGLELKSRAQSKVVSALLEEDIGMPADIVELKNYDDGLKMSPSETKTA